MVSSRGMISAIHYSFVLQCICFRNSCTTYLGRWLFGKIAPGVPVKHRLKGTAPGVPVKHRLKGTAPGVPVKHRLKGIAPGVPVKHRLKGTAPGVPVKHRLKGTAPGVPVKHRLKGTAPGVPVHHRLKGIAPGVPVHHRLKVTAPGVPVKHRLKGTVLVGEHLFMKSMSTSFSPYVWANSKSSTSFSEASWPAWWDLRVWLLKSNHMRIQSCRYSYFGQPVHPF